VGLKNIHSSPNGAEERGSMPKLVLEGLTIGRIDWDLDTKLIEEVFVKHDSLDQFHRYCLELKKTPVKYWGEADRDEPTKMWSDGVYVNGKSDFRRDWYGLPEYLIHEIMRVFEAKVIIAQVQAATDGMSEDPDEHRFVGDPKHIDVKLIVYLDYQIENPTNYLAAIRRKMASVSFSPDNDFRKLLYEALAKEDIVEDEPEESDDIDPMETLQDGRHLWDVEQRVRTEDAELGVMEPQ